jgi:hypothetical protein
MLLVHASFTYNSQKNSPVSIAGCADCVLNIPSFTNLSPQASYEFFSAGGQDPHPLELLARPNVLPAHMYPFMHLLPDGRMFIFVSVTTSSYLALLFKISLSPAPELLVGRMLPL